MEHDAHSTSTFAHLAGRFIVFEGPDGSGKSTQLRRLINEATAAGLAVCDVREPGGTLIGGDIRDILLDHAHGAMTLRCEMLLYMASRAQLVEQVVLPAISRGEVVIADRFVSSTYAYQGYAGGLPLEEIDAVARVATRGIEPDLVIVFDVDEHTAAKRLSPLLDRMEAKGREFHAKVRAGYLKLVQQAPKKHLKIDASQAPDRVWADLIAGLSARLGKTAGAGGSVAAR